MNKKIEQQKQTQTKHIKTNLETKNNNTQKLEHKKEKQTTRNTFKQNEQKN